MLARNSLLGGHAHTEFTHIDAAPNAAVQVATRVQAVEGRAIADQKMYFIK